MSAAETRNWTCPECGSVVQLPKMSLDPIACSACVSKKYTLKKEPASAAATDPIAMATGAIGNPLVLAGIAGVVCLLLGFVGGLVTGYVVFHSADVSARQTSSSHSRSTPIRDDEPVEDASTETASREPKTKPGYTWVDGYTRKDGKKVDGHWRKAD